MSLIQLEIDQDTLARAMRLGGHRTESEAVAAALDEYNKFHAEDPVFDDMSLPDLVDRLTETEQRDLRPLVLRLLGAAPQPH